jgi:hypothetical protein
MKSFVSSKVGGHFLVLILMLTMVVKKVFKMDIITLVILFYYIQRKIKAISKLTLSIFLIIHIVIKFNTNHH